MASDKDGLKGGGFGDFASDGTMDIVAYIVIALGLLFTFFNPTVGGVLVGVVFGIYFAGAIMCHLKGVENTYNKLGMPNSIVLAGGLLALVISIPTFFVTAAVVGAITSLIKPKAGKDVDLGASSESSDED